MLFSSSVQTTVSAHLALGQDIVDSGRQLSALEVGKIFLLDMCPFLLDIVVHDVALSLTFEVLAVDLVDSLGGEYTETVRQ